MTDESKQRRKNPNWGGKREGAGRKRENRTYSAEKLGELNQRIDTWARKKGKHMDEVALEILYDEENTPAARIQAYKTLKEYSTIKAGEGGEADILGPQIFLPEKRAEVTVFPGGKDEK